MATVVNNPKVCIICLALRRKHNIVYAHNNVRILKNHVFTFLVKEISVDP